MPSLEHILVGLIVLVCLVYAVRKMVGILRGKECDGCSFCPPSEGRDDSTACAGCDHKADCKPTDKDRD